MCLSTNTITVYMKHYIYLLGSNTVRHIRRPKSPLWRRSLSFKEKQLSVKITSRYFGLSCQDCRRILTIHMHLNESLDLRIAGCVHP